MDNNQPDHHYIVNEQRKESNPSGTPQKVLTTASSLSSDNKALAIISLILSFFSITFGIPLVIVTLVMMKKNRR